MSQINDFLDGNAAANPAIGANQPKSSIDDFLAVKPKRSLVQAMNDNVVEAANAAAGTVSAVGNFVSPGNTVSQWIDKNFIEAGEATQSDVVKAEKQRYAQEMEQAQGIGDEVGATLGYVARNPILAASQAVGSFAGPGLAVGGARLAAGALGLGAKAATRSGLVAGAGLGATGAGGDAAGTAYDLAKEGGATDEEAVAAARGASVIPAAIGAAGGLVGAERLVAGAGGFKGGLVSRALKTAGVEGAQEAVEEGVTQYEGQRAAVPFNPELDPAKGVAGAATMGAVLGGATGAGVSALTGQNQPARKPSEDLGLNPDNGPMSKLAVAVVDSKPLQLAHNPDPMVSFPDGSVGTQSQLDAYLEAMREAERIQARAKLMGLAPQPADSHLPPEGWQEQYQEQPVRDQEPVADPLGELQQQVRQSTAYTDTAEVQAARQAVEDAWLAVNVGDAPVEAHAAAPGVNAAPADTTAETDARVRAGRVSSGVRNAFDANPTSTLAVIQHVNKALRNIGEQTLSSPEIARIRRLADARTAFAGLNQPANLPADRGQPAPATDPMADNSAMEALIPERREAAAPTHTQQQGQPNGSPTPIDNKSQTAAPIAPQVQAPESAAPQQEGVADAAQTTQAQPIAAAPYQEAAAPSQSPAAPEGTPAQAADVATAVDGLISRQKRFGLADANGEVMFSRGPQTETDAFKRWYGDWQNAGHVQEQMEPYSARARTPQDGGDSSVHGLQRSSGMDQDAAGADPVRGIAFTGASGPTGADGAPVRFYHGTKDDIAAFDLSHPGRKDLGWLGNGVYLTSNEVDAEGYSRAKSGAHAPNVMPLYANVRNPYEASQADKQRLKHASQAAIQAFTQEVKAKGHDGVVLRDAGGDIELVVFDPAQVKSATGNNGGFDGSNPDIRYSLTAKPVINPTAIQLRRSMVQRTVNSLTGAWSQQPDITVVDSMNDPRVPERVREADQAQRSQGAMGEPEGFWYEGKVYLVASALPSSADATRVLYHEVLGHHGLKGHFGKELDKVLSQVAKMRPKDVRAKAEDYGLDMGNPDHIAYAAEEVLAEMAQTRPDLGFVQRAISAIRNFLREHVPGFKSLELKDADIVQGYLLPARGWVERTNSESEGSRSDVAPAMSRSPMKSVATGDAVPSLDQFKNEKPLWERTGPSAPTVKNSPPYPRGQSGMPTLPPTSKSDNIAPMFSRSQPAEAIRSSMGNMTPDQERAYLAVAGFDKVPTLKERFDSFKANLGLRMKQALVDQFAPIAQLDQSAYMLARMSKGSDGTLEAALMYGRPFLRDGVPDVDVKEGGFAKVLAGLQGEHDRFLMHVAAQRAESLKAQGKENLFSDQDIASLKTLNDGQMPDGTSRKQAYAKALMQLNSFNESVLRMAKESGLIDQDAYDLMKDQPYVPFYRLMEEEGGLQGPSFSKGLTNQKAWKKLKGGTEQLNADLLQNMLLNWGNLYAASARNRAALATMDAADKMAIAYKVPSDTKGAAKVMRDGMTEYWMVEDPHLLEAISALNYQASPLMKPLAKAKQWLTMGVTVNPTFKVRNLIRDVVSSMAIADLSYNPAANVAKGWKLTARDSQVYASMLASGGVIKFGTQEQTDRARKQAAKLSGVTLDQNGAQKLWGQMKALYEVYDDFGDRTENVNRAALYDRLIAKGHSHADASFMARDLMDFSMSGNAPIVRFLTQSVPFLNARMQGLYKLGRAAKEDPRRFATVAMAVSAASLGLMAAYADDEDWKRREDWDRDSYWWFKIGETAYRIPKPFEVGAIGTLAERTAEAMFSDEMDSKRFMERMSHMVSQTFAFDPVPQLFKPLLDIYANKDSFTGRAIESQADQRLRPEDRYNERTSEVARFLGQMGLPDPAQLVKGEYTGLSPKQIDHLMRGYFSWMATASTVASDAVLRNTVVDRGESPDMRLKDMFLVGNFVESLPTGASRYVSAMYEQSRAVEQAYASYRDALASGDQEGAAAIMASDGDKIRSRASVANATKLLAQLNAQAKRVQADTELSGEEKRERLNRIEQRRHEIAQRVMGRPAT